MQTRVSSTLVLLLFGIVHGLLVSGCDDTGEALLHQHVVCVTPTDAQHESCAGLDKTALFNTWANEAISQPGSTFSVWGVGVAPQQHRHVFSACVPTQWSTSVSQAKAHFIMRARQGVTGTQIGLVEPAGCKPPEPKTPGIHQLTVSPAATSLHPDVWQQVASAGEAPPLHVSIVCDRSGWTRSVACNATALLHAFDFWVAEGLARPGSSLSVAVVGSSRDATRIVYDLSVPDLAVGQRIATILGARTHLATLTSKSCKKNASAIVEAIHASVSTLRERDGRYVLLVLSALRQLTPEWDFELTVPQPPAFLAWLKKTHLLPDLRTIPVRVCGLHNRRSPGRGPFTAKRAAQLQELWAHVFHAAGASEVHLFSSSCDSGFPTS